MPCSNQMCCTHRKQKEAKEAEGRRRKRKDAEGSRRKQKERKKEGFEIVGPNVGANPRGLFLGEGGYTVFVEVELSVLQRPDLEIRERRVWTPPRTGLGSSYTSHESPVP